ncbi:MAG: hypothetical protein ACK5TR_04270 [Alphaproteobacteria bacterium]|jgi:hypothetical protein|nr:hypothetical protein [Alphaproteobacteria bacterium]
MKKRNLFFILLLTISIPSTPSIVASPASSDDESETYEPRERYQPPSFAIPVRRSPPCFVHPPLTGCPQSRRNETFIPSEEMGMQSTSLPDPHELAFMIYLKQAMSNEGSPPLRQQPHEIFAPHAQGESDEKKIHKNFSEDPRSMEALDLDGTQPKTMVDILAKKAAYYKERYHDLQEAHTRLLSQLNASRIMTSKLEQALFMQQIQYAQSSGSDKDGSSSDDDADAQNLDFAMLADAPSVREEQKKEGSGVPFSGQ